MSSTTQNIDNSFFLSRLLRQTSPRIKSTGFPSITTIRGAVAFCDISGFTALTSKHAKLGPSGIESLGKLLNTHYENLLATIAKHNGDVIAIVGDAALILFSESALSEGPAAESESADPAQDCLRAIGACLDIIRTCNFGISVHIGISCGTMHAVHLGEEDKKTQFLLVGEPLEHLKTVVSSAQSGTICVSATVRQLVTQHMSSTNENNQSPTIKRISLSATLPYDFASTSISFSNVGPGVFSIGKTSSVVFPQRPRNLSTSRLFLDEVDSDGMLSSYLCDSVIGKYSHLGSAGLGACTTDSAVDWLAEWRRLTVVFVQFHDFKMVEMTEQVNRLQECFLIVNKAVRTHDGTLLHAFNDDKGIVAVLVFGLPLKSHENDPSRALACAWAIHMQLMSKLGQSVSIGVTTSNMFCGCVGSSRRREFTVLGPAVNLAARLMTHIPPYSISCPILCDQETKEASAQFELFDFSAVKPIAAKGFQNPVAAFHPLPIASAITPRPAGKEKENFASESGRSGGRGGGKERVQQNPAIIGREKEVEIIANEIDKWRFGSNHIILLEGDAGAGKSKLTNHLLAQILASDVNRRSSSSSEQQPPLVFHVKTNHLISSDFRIWAQVLTKCVNFFVFGRDGMPHNLPREVTESLLVHMFSQNCPSLIPYLALLNPFLSTNFDETPQFKTLSGEPRAEIFFEISEKIIFSILKFAPICMFVEDVHAFDPSSWAFAKRLRQLAVKMSRNVSTLHSFLLLMNTRTQKKEFRDHEGFLEFLSSGAPNETTFSKFHIGPLADGSVSALVQSLVPGALSISKEVLDLVQNSSQGNALFVRELCFSLMQQDLLTIGADGCCHLSTSLPTFHYSSPASMPKTAARVPQTIHDVLCSRIDGLSPDQQLFIKVASVVGSDFDLNSISLIHPSHPTFPQVEKWAEEVKHFGLINDTLSAFNHHLTQEVTYSLLTPSQKITLHRKMAHLLEHGPAKFGVGPSSEHLIAESDGESPNQQHQQDEVDDENSDGDVDEHHHNLFPLSHSDSSLPGQIDSQQTVNPEYYAEEKKIENPTSMLDSQKQQKDLAALVHHFLNGKVPEKTREYLSALATLAHVNYNNREAIRHFELLLEQEAQCAEKSPPMTLALWYKNLGECYYFLGNHAQANRLLLKALECTSMKLPSTRTSKLTGLIKATYTQAYWIRKGRIPPKVPNEQVALEQIRILKTLFYTFYNLPDLPSAILCVVLGLNLCQRTSLAIQESPLYYSVISHTVRSVGPKSWAKWADVYYDKIAQLPLSQLEISGFQAPSSILLCRPTAYQEVENAIEMELSVRNFKNLGYTQLCAFEHCYETGYLDGLEKHRRQLEDEMNCREDLQVKLHACLAVTLHALMSDDRVRAATFLKKAVNENTEKAAVMAVHWVPLLAAHLIFRDIKWPLPTSPHFTPLETEKILLFAGANPSRGGGEREVTMVTDSGNSRNMVNVQRLIEAGLAKLRTPVPNLSFSHPFCLGFELTLLHGVPCDSKTLHKALKLFEKVGSRFNFFRPVSLMWSAFEKFQKNWQDPQPFVILKQAIDLAAQHKLVFQEAFSNFLLSHVLEIFMKKSKLGKLNPKKIQKITECDGPLENERLKRVERAKELFLQCGHTFYESVAAFL